MAKGKGKINDEDADGTPMMEISPEETDNVGLTSESSVKSKSYVHEAPAKLWLHFVWSCFFDQLRAIVPIAVFLMLFKTFALRQSLDGVVELIFGLGAVVLGLTFFMYGLTYGVMPLGDAIGVLLPEKLSRPIVILLAGVLGVAVTFAEPALMSLDAAKTLIKPERSPLLWTILNEQGGLLVIFVGLGVGLATSVGMLRILYNWNMKPLIFTLVPISLGLTFLCKITGRDEAVGLAWDLGAVTTGPVTVPIVLSLGVGVAKSTGNGATGMTGFGIVTLASLFPVTSVLLFILLTPWTTPSGCTSCTEVLPLYLQFPYVDMVMGTRAIVPLLFLMWFILKVLLRHREPVRVQIPAGERYESIAKDSSVLPGQLVAWIGVIIFNIGLKKGLAALGSSVGEALPAVFVEMSKIENSPFLPYLPGVGVACGFSFLLGFGATFAEPALNTLGRVVEELTNGSFGKNIVMWAVSVGVGLGIGIGVSKLIFDEDIVSLLTALYPAAMAMTIASTADFTSVSWDSAGVTTGPITVPLVMALGLGIGKITHAADGFGVLAMASVLPIMTMLATGLVRNFGPKPAPPLPNTTPTDSEDAASSV